MLLEGKIAIVTGAGKGIGRATARLFSREGASVVVAERDPRIGAATAEEIVGGGRPALFVQTDVSSSADVGRMVERAVETFGGIDILVNNAGIDAGKALLDTSEDDWDLVQAVNLKGTFLCSKAVVPHMVARGGGSIVNTASVLALSSLPNCGAYCASKAGVMGLTRSMVVEWSRLGIRVNCVLPGSTDTDMMWMGLDESEIDEERERVSSTIPLGYVADPEQIAQASLWFCSPASGFAAGSFLIMDGGAQTRSPSLR